MLRSRTWVEDGSRLFTAQVAALDEPGMAQPSLLPGWTRKHVVAHVAANAEALGNLVHWAKTGEPTPMYPSREQRDADIEAGATLPASRLVAWLEEAVRELDTAMDGLSGTGWQAEVRTAQGKPVPATAIPWLRAREVWLHAVDLGTGVTFADLPGEFLTELVADVQAQRGLTTVPDGPLPEVAAYLTGRPHSLVNAPDLGPWL
ncbi:maleylpyruvate isomerase family mycothiol-dependent enzyme [Amycolatopsis sacchari]|uniref:maleylpyruvate isomerase family mycothiol-dependent enzyme n=1 Tax=Amycolatopsis sacchari TaxID=115433 RepID=UPI003EBF3A4D